MAVYTFGYFGLWLPRYSLSGDVGYLLRLLAPRVFWSVACDFKHYELFLFSDTTDDFMLKVPETGCFWKKYRNDIKTWQPRAWYTYTSIYNYECINLHIYTCKHCVREQFTKFIFPQTSYEPGESDEQPQTTFCTHSTLPTPHDALTSWEFKKLQRKYRIHCTANILHFRRKNRLRMVRNKLFANSSHTHHLQVLITRTSCLRVHTQL